MTVFGIPWWRLILYAGAAALLIVLNMDRLQNDANGPVPQPSSFGVELPELPELSVAAEFNGFSSPPRRNLFRPAIEEPEPVAPEPEPEAAPAPDPKARAIAEAEAILEDVRVIGFLSTAEGGVAVLNFQGAVINAFEGDEPVPGFRVSDVTTSAITLEHRDIDFKRTLELEDAEQQ